MAYRLLFRGRPPVRWARASSVTAGQLSRGNLFGKSILASGSGWRPLSAASIGPADNWRGRHFSCSRFTSTLATADGDVENNNNQDISDMEDLSPDDEAVEKMYSRKTPLEHVLLRPGMYVGPNERLPPTSHWLLDPIPPPPPPSSISPPGYNYPPIMPALQALPPGTPFRMVKKEVGLVPALIKIFDEILVNASDNRLRHPKSCTRIDVWIDPGCSKEGRPPWIRVLNDGKGLPIQIHPTEKMYVPELLFGHLLTGSNFDDERKRLTGGRHGYGAKLANIFSQSFTVETHDAKKRLLYRQTWTNNMTQASAPDIIDLRHPASEIVATSGFQGDYTCITLVPDVARLTGDPQATVLEEPDYAFMCRRVLDVAGCTAGQLQVTLNGLDVSQASFADYARLYRHQESSSRPIVLAKVNSRWTVGVGLSESGSMEAISFVNGMATSRGGTHINALVQQITKCIQDQAIKIEAELADQITPALIKRHLQVFCDALIENPTFDSQMKECLTSSPAQFGSSCTLPKSFLKALVKPEEEDGPGLVEEVVRAARGRLQANLWKEMSGKKSNKRYLQSIPKLEEAHLAGTDQGGDCTLILTEGDSAKALAVAGLEVVGRKRFGVFPLRGKFLNVRDAPVSQISGNAEVKALCAILGLEFDKAYATVEERRRLRYGRVMLMTDQDTDGSHIKGLVINFFHHFWPKLLQPPSDHEGSTTDQSFQFLSSFVTPLLKATRKGGKEVLSFYSIAEYQVWRSTLSPDDMKRWSVKYYKGLGTSTPAEAKEYFLAFDRHVRPFYWNSHIDGEVLEMVFDKGRAADRRQWILDEYDENSVNEVSPDDGNKLSYQDFVNKEMIHFSHADNIRSIPSVIDGFKPSQRKVLYACFKRNLKAEVKVAQLTGYCAEHTAYHHGEASLQSTIIGMAQDFVGSNNINLLVPSGQFGTRLTGGTDAASPRYIFTYLSPIARCLFPEMDDMLLKYREDDGQSIEPEFYCPIIPLLLVNGSQGIGTGWSTFIPPHSPYDVVDYIRSKLDGNPQLPPIRPFARGYKGSIVASPSGNGYVSIGIASRESTTSVMIEELPLRCWTNSYKEQLSKMVERDEISGFLENHTTSKVSFTVTLKAKHNSRLQKSSLEKVFKLEASLSTRNMHAFDVDYNMARYETAESIADAHFQVRLRLYHDRKVVMESEMEYISRVLRNKARFVEAVVAGTIDLLGGRKTREETAFNLKNLGFDPASALKTIRRRTAQAQEPNELLGAGSAIDSSIAAEFDYLMNMPISSLTSDKIFDLRQDAEKKESELSTLRSTDVKDLWRQDLDKLVDHLE